MCCSTGRHNDGTGHEAHFISSVIIPCRWSDISLCFYSGTVLFFVILRRTILYFLFWLCNNPHSFHGQVGELFLFRLGLHIPIVPPRLYSKWFMYRVIVLPGAFSKSQRRVFPPQPSASWILIVTRTYKVVEMVKNVKWKQSRESTAFTTFSLFYESLQEIFQLFQSSFNFYVCFFVDSTRCSSRPPSHSSPVPLHPPLKTFAKRRNTELRVEHNFFFPCIITFSENGKKMKNEHERMEKLSQDCFSDSDPFYKEIAETLH